VVQERCSQDDLQGHGAIRLYFDLQQDEGKNFECTDFSKPDKFPRVIIRAIKSGAFKGMVAIPEKLLIKPLDDKYQADRKSLYDKYWADRKPLDDKYWADRKPLYDKYWADRESLYDKYWADRKPLDDKCQADRKSLYDKYWADRKPLYDKYWDLFAISENRNPVWR
jgi:hypothetical protein